MSIIPSYTDQAKTHVLNYFGDKQKAAHYFGINLKTFNKYINDIPKASATFKIKLEFFLQSHPDCLILSETEFIKLVAYRSLESVEGKVSFLPDGLRALIESCKNLNRSDLQSAFELCLYTSVYKASGEPAYYEKALRILETVRKRTPSPINIAIIINGLIFGYKHFPYFVELSKSDPHIEKYILSYKKKFTNLSQNSCPCELLHSYEDLHSEWVHLSEKLYSRRLYDYYTYLGAAYFRVTDYKNSLTNFQLAAKYRVADSDKVEVFTNLSISYFMLQDRSSAFEHLNLALKHIDESDPRINNIYLNAWEMIRLEGQTEFAKSYMDQVNFAKYIALEGGTAHITESLFEEFDRTGNCDSIKRFFLVVIDQYSTGRLDFRRIEWIINYVQNFLEGLTNRALVDTFFNVTKSIYEELDDENKKYISKDIFDQFYKPTP